MADLSKVFGSEGKSTADTRTPVAVIVKDLVLEIIDSVLEDVIAFKASIDGERVETECKEKDETIENNNSEATDYSENKEFRILRNLQPQPLQVRKRVSEAELEDEGRDKKMKNST